MQPRYQPSTSDKFGAPGTYIKPLAVSAPVRGLFAGVTGVCGLTTRGPSGRRIEINSPGRFFEVFGGRDYGVNGGAVVGKIWSMMQGRTFGLLEVVRVVASDAVVASFNAETAAGGAGVECLHIAANGAGLGGNDIQWKVADASDGNANHFNLLVKLYDQAWLWQNLSIFGTDDNLALTLGADDSVPIVLTKITSGRPVTNAPTVDGADANGYTKLGQVVALFTSVAGSDGALVDTDFTGAGKAMEILNGARGIDHCLVAGRSTAAIKTKVLALAPTANDRLWLICPDNETVSEATAITEAATLRHQNVVYCFNHPYITDPVTGGVVVQEPNAQMACILSQTEPDVHPGVVDTSGLNTAIVRLYNELQDPDRDSLDLAGVTFLDRDLDQDGNEVWLFGNGRTTDLAVNNSQIDGQRSKFYLVAGLAQRMRGDEKRPNTIQLRAARKAAFEGWLTELALKPRFVAVDDVSKQPQFEVKNDSEVNTQTDWDAGIQRDLVRVKLIPKNLYLQLQVQIGTGVTFSF